MESPFQTIREVINHDFFFNNLSNRVKDLISFWKLAAITQFLEIFLSLFIIIHHKEASLDFSNTKMEDISEVLVIWALVIVLFAIVNTIDIYKQIMTSFAINRVINVTMIDGDKVKLSEIRIILIAALTSLLAQAIHNVVMVPFLGIVSFGIKGFFYWKSLKLREINLIS